MEGFLHVQCSALMTIIGPDSGELSTLMPNWKKTLRAAIQVALVNWQRSVCEGVWESIITG